MTRVTLLLTLCCLPVYAEPDLLAGEIDLVLEQADPFAATADGVTREFGLNKKKDWYVGITPYIWFTGFNVETGGERISSEFGDVAALANSGFMVIGSIDWKRWSFGLDYTYADLGDDTHIERATASFRFRQHILHLMAGYAVLDGGDRHNPTGVRLRLQVGARYWDTNARIDVVIPPLIPGNPDTQVNIDEGTSWWDLTTGFGARWPLNKKVDFRLWGNVGGFGIGSSSDYTWEAGFVTSFLVTRMFGFHVGYRMLQYKRESGGVDTKLTMQGPIIGFTFVF